MKTLMEAAEEGQADIVESLLSRPGIIVDPKALSVACRNGHLGVVKLLVAAGATLECQAGDEWGPRGLAVCGGHLQVVKYLVEWGADEQRRENHDMTLIMLAAGKGHAEIAKYLLGRPRVNVDAKTNTGQRAINCACHFGNLEVVKLLMAAGARVEWQASDETGALASAALGGHLQVVKYLVEECGADASRADPSGATPLTFAANQGHVEIVKYLLVRPGIIVNAKDEREMAIKCACRHGHLEVVKLLVAAGARVDCQPSDETGALASAVLGAHLHVVKYLVEECGADTNSADVEGWVPLMVAAQEGQPDMVEYLLGRPAINVDAKANGGDRAINCACGSGHVECVKLLVAAGARLESQASDEAGALTSAVLGAHLHVVKYLVEECGADASRPDPTGELPLMFAVSEGHAEIVKYLLGRPGINVDAKIEQWGRVIHIACRGGHVEVVKLLVAAGARVECQATDEEGALMSAVLKGHLEVVKYLVEEAGADASRGDVEGWTPLMLAIKEGHANIVEYLQLHASQREQEVRSPFSDFRRIVLLSSPFLT
jgi:ankyrin repeat protein